MAEELQETDWLKEGMIVELRSDQEGFQGAWFPVQIKELRYKKSGAVCRQVVVEHLDFASESDNEPDSKQVPEVVKKDHLRPLPPKLPHKQWKEKDAVETWQAGAWWAGSIKRYNAEKDTYLVFYGRQSRKDLEVAPGDVRSRLDFVKVSPFSSLLRRWKPWKHLFSPKNCFGCGKQ